MVFFPFFSLVSFVFPSQWSPMSFLFFSWNLVYWVFHLREDLDHEVKGVKWIFLVCVSIENRLQRILKLFQYICHKIWRNFQIRYRILHIIRSSPPIPAHRLTIRLTPSYICISYICNHSYLCIKFYIIWYVFDFINLNRVTVGNIL